MDTVSKLYSLISSDVSINTFKDNYELFKEFYSNYKSIKLYGDKVLVIYKYILSLNLDDTNEDMPFINSKILYDINSYEQTITQSVYFGDSEPDNEYVDKLLNFISFYTSLQSMNLKEIVSPEAFIRDYTGAMMLILNKSFLEIDNDRIFKMFSMIKNNDYLKRIIEEGKIGKSIMDKDYVFQYTTRFLFNLEFANEENLENDELLTALKTGKINDYKSLQSLFKNINEDILFDLFDDNSLSKFLSIIEESIKDDFPRRDLFSLLVEKVKKANEPRILMGFILHDIRCEDYLEPDEIKTAVETFICNYPSNITEEEIEYILSRDDLKSTTYKLFQYNLKTDIESGRVSDKYMKYVSDVPSLKYSFEEAIAYLDDLFKNKKNGNITNILASLNAIIKERTQASNLRVYYRINENHGCANVRSDGEYIMLNLQTIGRMCATLDVEKEPELIKIIETIYHELRHVGQFTDIMNEDIYDEDAFMQYKESIVRKISSNYYDDNYIDVSFEADARISGAEFTVKLLEDYFSYLPKTIEHYKEKLEKEKTRKINDKKIFELSSRYSVDEILSKMISINPSILDKYPLLKKGFNIDGSIKEPSKAY